MSKTNIFEKLMQEIGNAYGVCGLMGNLEAESGMRSNNAQNSCMKRLNMTDESYTKAVDDGTYSEFGVDRVGYGICQWTSAGRKTALLAFARERGKSIADENMQLDYLMHELSTSYKSVLNVLKSAGSVKEASDIVVLKFERPASVGKDATESQKAATLAKRQAFGEAIYNEFAGHKKEEAKMHKVCIDAGHYGKYNRSPGIPEYYESEIMWKLHLLQKKYLEALGIEVVTTRSNPAKDLALQARGKKAKGCDLFISNHSNATGGGMNEKIDHVAVYHLTNDTTTNADDKSAEIAKLLAPIIANIMGVKQGFKVLTRKSGNDRNGDGMPNDNYYGVLHGARLVNVPGLILEHSFHTNSAAVKWLLNENNLDKLAKAEAECIANYLKGISAPEATEKAEAQEKAEEPKKDSSLPYKVKITASALNVRAGAGTGYKVNATVKRGEVYTIVAESAGWGKLKSGAGWISLKYAEKC